ncbi:hypothetical protein [Nocardia sp. NPDC050406]|uniref:hypothetical protein n=1 Tax=Nocardia sp. NPDC050406 TaxID=3364318 RepID=UPI0037A6A345
MPSGGRATARPSSGSSTLLSAGLRRARSATTTLTATQLRPAATGLSCATTCSGRSIGRRFARLTGGTFATDLIRSLAAPGRGGIRLVAAGSAARLRSSTAAELRCATGRCVVGLSARSPLAATDRHFARLPGAFASGLVRPPLTLVFGSVRLPTATRRSASAATGLPRATMRLRRPTGRRSVRLTTLATRTLRAASHFARLTHAACAAGLVRLLIAGRDNALRATGLSTAGLGAVVGATVGLPCAAG